MQTMAMLTSESMRLNGALDYVANIISKKYFNKSVLDITIEEIESKLKEIKSVQNARDQQDYEITRNECYFKLILSHDRHTEKTVHTAIQALDRLIGHGLLSCAAAYKVVERIKHQMQFQVQLEKYYESLEEGEKNV